MLPVATNKRQKKIFFFIPCPVLCPGLWCFWRLWSTGRRGCCWLSGPDRHQGSSPSWPSPPQLLSAHRVFSWSHPAGPPELWRLGPPRHSEATQKKQKNNTESGLNHPVTWMTNVKQTNTGDYPLSSYEAHLWYQFEAPMSFHVVITNSCFDKKKKSRKKWPIICYTFSMLNLLFLN